MSRFPHVNATRDPLSSTRANGVKVVVAHDYIYANLGNSRTLTANWNGGSVKGSVPENVSNAWFRLVDGKDGKVGTLVERINAFIDGIATLWPEWDKAADTSAFIVGARGSMFLGPRKGSKGFEIVELPKRKGGNYTIKFDGDNSRTLVAADMLTGTLPG